jgi:hypothetical protein
MMATTAKITVNDLVDNALSDSADAGLALFVDLTVVWCRLATLFTRDSDLDDLTQGMKARVLAMREHLDKEIRDTLTSVASEPAQD